MLEKINSVDMIEVVSDGSVQVRTRCLVFEDGKQVAGSLHRHVVVPGADFSAEDPRVQAVCAAVHTPDVIAAFNAAKGV